MRVTNEKSVGRPIKHYLTCITLYTASLLELPPTDLDFLTFRGCVSQVLGEIGDMFGGLLGRFGGHVFGDFERFLDSFREGSQRLTNLYETEQKHLRKFIDTHPNPVLQGSCRVQYFLCLGGPVELVSCQIGFFAIVVATFGSCRRVTSAGDEPLLVVGS